VLLTPAVQKFSKGRIQGRPTFYPEVDLKIANWLVVGTLVQTDLFLSVGGFHEAEHGFEDFGLWSKCVRVGARIVKVPRAIYIQHINPNSKHRLGWRNRKWQIATHERVIRELDAWDAERA
jgi:GT2 family glycosyltransferase